MIPEETINKFVRDMINLILATPNFAIKAKQLGDDELGTPRPIGAYADVDFVNDTGLGLEQRTFENNGDDLTETLTGMREIMMSVNFYRDLAVDKCRSVRIGLVRESVQELFKSSNLGLTRRSEVREISEALENGWEERAQFDIVLSAVGTDTDIVRAIANVDIAAEYQARGLKYNYTIGV